MECGDLRTTGLAARSQVKHVREIGNKINNIYLLQLGCYPVAVYGIREDQNNIKSAE